ncbi:Gp15 family bacteriophage protein [Streptococcus iniae]
MFDISKKIDDKLILNEKEYQLFLSFDRVLKVFDMWSDNEINDLIKPNLALCMLTKTDDFRTLQFKQAMDLYEQVFNEHIKIVKLADQIDRYDIAGNLLPKNRLRRKMTMKMMKSGY